MNTISWEFCGWHQTNVQICSYIRRHYRNLNTTPEICDVIQGIREPQHIPAQKTTEYVKKIPEYVKRPNILNKIPGSEVSTSGSCTLMPGGSPSGDIRVGFRATKSRMTETTTTTTNSSSHPPKQHNNTESPRQTVPLPVTYHHHSPQWTVP